MQQQFPIQVAVEGSAISMRGGVPGRPPFVPKQLSGRLAGARADLRSQVIDLQFVEDAAERLASLDQNADPLLTRALWSSIAITYRRGFAGGSGQLGLGRSRRNIERDFVDRLSPELVSTHDVLIGLADRHIAHRVDAELEVCATVLLLQGEPEPKGVAGYGELIAIQIGGDPSIIGRIQNLVLWIIIPITYSDRLRLPAVLDRRAYQRAVP